MTILSDVEIEELCSSTLDRPMISPFTSEMVKRVPAAMLPSPVGDRSEAQILDDPAHWRRIISRGLSSYGYDVSLSDEFKLFTNIHSPIVDPKNLDERCLVDATLHYDNNGDVFVILPPNSYILGRTIEYFIIPRDVMVVCVGKSTYARAGAIVNVTPIEPGFEGHIVIEISNSTSSPLKIYANEGISQFLFFRGSRECRTSYADRLGKYQGQTGVTLPKV